MNYILYCEWMKLKRSKMLWIGMLGTLIVPVLVIVNAIRIYFLKTTDRLIVLQSLYSEALLFLQLIFAPLILSVVAAWLVEREYSEKTIKTLFSVPISAKMFLWGKYFILFCLTILFFAAVWLEITILAIICSFFVELRQISILCIIPNFIKLMIAAVYLYMAVMPILYLTIRTKSFLMPLITAIIMCLLNVVLSGAPFADIYPWTATYFALDGLINGEKSTRTIGIWLLFLIAAGSYCASMWRFQKEDIL